MSAASTFRRPTVGARGAAALALAVAAALAWRALDLTFADLTPRSGGANLAREFFAAALRPAWSHEGAHVPPSAAPFPVHVASSLARTVVFAAAALSLALPSGLLLGWLASRTWWIGVRQRALGRVVQAAARTLSAGLRSIHELLWAVLLLAAVGIEGSAAVLALAIPFTGILAKVIAELLDETPPESANALRQLGASPFTSFLFGTFPRALPDIAAYSFYRFECAIRSAAALGFFGFATLGHDLKLSFDNLHYREVWSYIYALVALVLVMEAWSFLLRRSRIR